MIQPASSLRICRAAASSALVLLFVVCFVQSALAEGFALYEYSARGIALGGTTMARKPDASAIASNPALITRLKGTHIQGGASAISPKGIMRTKLNGHTETSHLKSHTWVIPNFYFTQEINDRLTFGIGEFSRFGLGFEYPHNWPGRFNVYSVSLESASIVPTLAVKVTDDFSLAIAAEIMRLRLDINKRAQNGPFEVDSDISDATSLGFGGHLAAHYQFTDQWAAGLVYRSQIRHKAEGHNEFTWANRKNFSQPVQNALSPAFNANFKDTDAHGTVLFPDSISAGISWTPVPEFSLEANATWTKWSNFRSLRIHLESPMDTVSESKKDWDDAWRIGLGAEYEPLDWLTLRAGVIYDQSPMTEKYEDYLVPTASRIIYSTGVGFKVDNWTLDLAYAYIDPFDRSYSSNIETQTLSSKTQDSLTHITSMSIGYSF